MTSCHVADILAFSVRPELVEGPFFSLTPREEGQCFGKALPSACKAVEGLSTNGLSLVVRQ